MIRYTRAEQELGNGKSGNRNFGSFDTGRMRRAGQFDLARDTGREPGGRADFGGV
ncbi:MAG: hypothetical protein AAF700_06675 [Pseudomonadota bacterium]